MKGDFTRNTFDALRHFRRVLLQQGRVALDSDWNEQTAILMHYLQALSADLIGPYSGPGNNCGFALTKADNDFAIGGGHYYVDGILCEIGSSELSIASISTDGKTITISSMTADHRQFSQNEWVEVIADDETRFPTRIQKTDGELKSLTCDPSLPGNVHWLRLRRLITYKQQLDYPDAALDDGMALVYADVWERHITSIQDDRIREVALGGPDTATRAKVVWQVKVIHQWSDGTKITNSKIFPLDKWNALVRTWNNQAACGLKVRLKPGQASADPCITSYKSSYRGQENQLYRVEIHDGGKIDGKSVPTFKWSRDNGSIVFPIISQEGSIVTLQSLGFDSRTTLKVGNWVEITDDTHEMQGKPGILAQVEEIVDPVEMKIRLKQPVDVQNIDWPSYDESSTNHPLLRLWNQVERKDIEFKHGSVQIKESNTDWLELENGIQIQFQPGGHYRTGDYWLIPARTNGTIEWPCECDDKGELKSDAPIAQSPHGITHHYAPLRIIEVTNGDVTLHNDLRRKFSVIQ